ncbi:glycosyltransferase family 2 protein [Rhodoferax sp.]|uniref:glycosyltransferase family 2 protein n=1 Tax=Rhodoferax sp. TaxID=50421 RepID=UPI0025DB5EA7|nr:glycosyltransferase family 2 protein [Rhodoferax sp.]
MAPKVTVIVLNWNGWADTLKCLASLHKLVAPAPAILLIDNHSTDDSVERITQAYPALEVLITNENRGFGGGCNVGMREALARSSDYIWLINSDATVEPQTLSAMVRMAESTPRLGAVGSVIYELGSTDLIQLWGGGRVNPWLGRSQPLRAPGELAFVSGASMLLRSSALHEIGLFDEETFFMYWEDTDLGFRLRRHGWQIGTADDSHVWHRGSGSLGRGSPKIDEYFVCSAVRFFRRHTSLPILPTVSLLTSMLVKRLFLGHWHHVRAVLRGLQSV